MESTERFPLFHSPGGGWDVLDKIELKPSSGDCEKSSDPGETARLYST
jgi:hypothetical protein